MDDKGLLDQDMPSDELRLHMGELTSDEVLVARAAIRWANTRATMQISGLKQVRDALESKFEEVEIDDFTHMAIPIEEYHELIETLDGIIAGGEVTCACGDTFTEDAKCINCITADSTSAPVHDVLNNCTGIPILYGFAEPVEGYAERPQDLIHVLHEMGREVVRLSKEVICLHEQLSQPRKSAPTPAQPEKVDVEKLKLECVEMWSPNPVSSEAIKAVIGHLAATYDFVRKV